MRLRARYTFRPYKIIDESSYVAFKNIMTSNVYNREPGKAFLSINYIPSYVCYYAATFECEEN